jgi:hypothetical protein
LQLKIAGASVSGEVQRGSTIDYGSFNYRKCIGAAEKYFHLNRFNQATKTAHKQHSRHWKVANCFVILLHLTGVD